MLYLLSCIVQFTGTITLCGLVAYGLSLIITPRAPTRAPGRTETDTGDLAATIHNLGNKASGGVVDMVAETRRMGEDAFKPTAESLAIYAAWKRREDHAARLQRRREDRAARLQRIKARLRRWAKLS